MKVTPDQQRLIAELKAQGKSTNEIAKATGISYGSVVYYGSKRASRKLASDKYVETDKPMPPVIKSELKIIADKELAEHVCQQMGLEKPVCSLSQRPRSYSASGWVWDGNKFIPGVTVSNNGMLVRQPLFRKTNRFATN